MLILGKQRYGLNQKPSEKLKVFLEAPWTVWSLAYYFLKISKASFPTRTD